MHGQHNKGPWLFIVPLSTPQPPGYCACHLTVELEGAGSDLAEVNMTFLPPPLGVFDLTSCARLRSASHRGSVGCRLRPLPPGDGCLASPMLAWLSVALVVGGWGW